MQYAVRDANSPAIFIPRGFGDSGNGETKTYSPDFWEFRGVVCFRFEVNLKFLLIEQIFLKLSFNSKE